ncbi:MAG: TIGR04211 family SH3 domain-containing protein [Litorivicinus sp.]
MKRLLACVLMLGCLSAQAQNAWITDQLEVPVRSGESNEYRILRFLDSGSEVTIVSRNSATGYSLVRDANNRDGYVLSRYLENEPTAAKRLADVQAQMRQVMDDAQNGAARIGQLRDQVETLTDERNAARQELASVKAELAEIRRISADSVAIFESNQTLREQIQLLEDESAILRSENLTLSDDRDKTFMLIGSGLVIAGIVLGLLLPNLRRRRRVDTW